MFASLCVPSNHICLITDFYLDEAQPANVTKQTPLISVQLFVAAQYVSSGMYLLINNCISSVCCVVCMHFHAHMQLHEWFHCSCKTFKQDTELHEQACKHALPDAKCRAVSRRRNNIRSTDLVCSHAHPKQQPNI